MQTEPTRPEGFQQIEALYHAALRLPSGERVEFLAQACGGNQVLRLLIDKWEARQVTIAVHLFDFPAASLDPVCQIEPLSWKLTSQQKACIGKGWSAELRARAERL